MLTTFFPNSTILKKYVDCIYIYSGADSKESGSTFRYLAYPHYKTGLSFFKGARITRKNLHVEIAATLTEQVSVEILGKYTSPVLIDYSGKIHEVSIIFKPLGINRFFRENYLNLAPSFSQCLHNNVWNSFGERLFSNEINIEKLEEFLISQFQDLEELNHLESSLILLNPDENEKSLVEISALLGYNLKTFQRHFKKHMGCTPIEYRRICRFRNSIELKLGNNDLKNLTSLTYESGYFDQSYFIKEFKKLTYHNPKEFFKVAKKIDGQQIIWEIL